MSVSFAPPLGVPIRYRVTETKTKDGQPRTQVTELVVRFEQAGDSYLMEGRVEIPGLPPHLAANPMVKIAFRPVTFRLDRDGGFESIENEDAYWEGLEPIIDTMIRDPKNPPGADGLIRDMFRKMREMPTAERAALVGRNFAQITARASFELEVGETVKTELEPVSIPMPVPDPKLRRAHRITLASASASTARIETETRIDQDDMNRFMRQLAELAPADKRPTELPEIQQSIVHVVARNTGLTLSSTETIRAATEGSDSSASKIVRIERLP